MPHFLTKLRSNFEHTCSVILNRKIVTTLDDSEHLAEETHLKSLSISTPLETTMVVSYHPDKSRRNPSSIECSHYKGKGHITSQCKSKIRRNYCKMKGIRLKTIGLDLIIESIVVFHHILLPTHTLPSSSDTASMSGSTSGAISPELMQSSVQAMSASVLSVGNSL